MDGVWNWADDKSTLTLLGWKDGFFFCFCLLQTSPVKIFHLFFDWVVTHSGRFLAVIWCWWEETENVNYTNSRLLIGTPEMPILQDMLIHILPPPQPLVVKLCNTHEKKHVGSCLWCHVTLHLQNCYEEVVGQVKMWLSLTKHAWGLCFLQLLLVSAVKKWLVQPCSAAHDSVDLWQDYCMIKAHVMHKK